MNRSEKTKWKFLFSPWYQKKYEICCKTCIHFPVLQDISDLSFFFEQKTGVTSNNFEIQELSLLVFIFISWLFVSLKFYLNSMGVDWKVLESSESLLLFCQEPLLWFRFLTSTLLDIFEGFGKHAHVSKKKVYPHKWKTDCITQLFNIWRILKQFANIDCIMQITTKKSTRINL